MYGKRNLNTQPHWVMRIGSCQHRLHRLTSFSPPRFEHFKAQLSLIAVNFLTALYQPFYSGKPSVASARRVSDVRIAGMRSHRIDLKRCCCVTLLIAAGGSLHHFEYQLMQRVVFVPLRWSFSVGYAFWCCKIIKHPAPCSPVALAVCCICGHCGHCVDRIYKLRAF